MITIFHTAGQLAPRGLAVAGQTVYFTDEAHRAIFYGEKKPYAEARPYKRYLDTIVNLKLYTSRKGNGLFGRRSSRNRLLSFADNPHACHANNGGCAQLCVPSPTAARKCICTNGFTLADDGANCTRIDKFLVIATDELIQASA